MRLVDYDPLTRTSKLFHYDHTDDTFVIKTVQDVEPILEANKAAMNSLDERAKHGEFDRVASIPMPIYMELQRKGIADDPTAFTRWLDDPDNRAFRTRPGKLSK
jgi:hypothetical protein